MATTNSAALASMFSLINAITVNMDAYLAPENMDRARRRHHCISDGLVWLTSYVKENIDLETLWTAAQQKGIHDAREHVEHVYKNGSTLTIRFRDRSIVRLVRNGSLFQASYMRRSNWRREFIFGVFRIVTTRRLNGAILRTYCRRVF